MNHTPVRRAVVLWWMVAGMVAWVPLGCRDRGDDRRGGPGKARSGEGRQPARWEGAPDRRRAARPGPRPQPSPPVASPSALDLPNAKGVTPLDLKAAAKLPYLQVPLAEVVAHARQTCGTLWYGLYLQNQKIGWGETSCGFARQGEREVLWERLELVLRVQSFGATDEMRIRVESRYALTGPMAGELLRFEMHQKSTREEQRLQVERRADGWHAARTYRGGKVRKPTATRVLRTVRSGLTNGERAYAAALARGKLPVGTRVRYLSFDDDDLKDQDNGLQVLATGERRLRGVTLRLAKLETLSLKDKVRGVGVHDAAGNLLEGTFQRVMRIRREEKATAKTMSDKATDFGLGLVIRAPMKLDAPGRVRRMKVRLQGFLPETLASHPRHQVKILGPQDVELTVSQESVEGVKLAPLPVRDPALAEYLKATHVIEVDHPRIKALARQALGDARETLTAAHRLNAFVFRYLRKDLTTNLDSALAILEAKAGDCTEHARLLVALCRAVGLPAREVGGVTWVPDLGGFGYHAWVEVYLGSGRWISVDPAWNEMPANATHIWMGGPNDGRWIGTLGSLSARVLDAEQLLDDGSVKHVRGEEDGGIDEDEDDQGDDEDEARPRDARGAAPSRDAPRDGDAPRAGDPRGARDPSRAADQRRAADPRRAADRRRTGSARGSASDRPSTGAPRSR